MGRRVSVRRTATHTPEGRQLYSDVVGDLVDLSSQTAVLASHGSLVVVPISDIAIARLVPASTADELALEEIAGRGWQAAETEALGGWLLRANGGFTIRANSVHAVRQPGLPLSEALDYARAWYAERGLPLRINVPTEARRLLDAELGERGFDPSPDNHVLVARLDRLIPGEGASDSQRPRAADAAGAAGAELTSSPDDEWFSRYRDGAGADPVSRALLLRHDNPVFASIRLDGKVAAVGRGVVDEGWLGIAAVEVDPAYRRQGLASAVMAALWSWGAAQGAERTYLQVASTNPGALALYTALGYWHHHDYRTRTELTDD